MSKKSIVKFLRPHGAYVKDDVAGFAPEHADRMIESGHAEAYTPPKADGEAPKGNQNGPGKK
jgi:hypothetical protein